MPIYEYRCRSCGNKFDLIRPISEYSPVEPCKCGKQADRNFSKPPAVFGDYAPYNCPITGRRIEGKREHEANLRRHGCRVLEPGETERFKQRKAREDAELEASVERTAEEFVTKLPTRQQEELAKGIESGLDVGFERKAIN